MPRGRRNGVARAVYCFSAVRRCAAGRRRPRRRGCAPLLDHSFPELLTGKPTSLCQYSGKVVLVVNTASACGFTPQYEGLEALYKRYAARGLVVIGFPSNDFGGQEPGSNKEVAEFCQLNYGVSFPMFEKTTVSGPHANPLHAALAQRGGGAAALELSQVSDRPQRLRVVRVSPATSIRAARACGAEIERAAGAVSENSARAARNARAGGRGYLDRARRALHV